MHGDMSQGTHANTSCHLPVCQFKAYKASLHLWQRLGPLTCEIRHVDPTTCPRRQSAGPSGMQFAPASSTPRHPRLHLLPATQKRCTRPAAKPRRKASRRSYQTCRRPRCCQSRKDGSLAPRAGPDQQGAAQGRLGYYEGNVSIPVAKG
jgi:hypothetical protein